MTIPERWRNVLTFAIVISLSLLIGVFLRYF
jgi:hypothetical protein